MIEKRKHRPVPTNMTHSEPGFMMPRMGQLGRVEATEIKQLNEALLKAAENNGLDLTEEDLKLDPQLLKEVVDPERPGRLLPPLLDAVTLAFGYMPSRGSLCRHYGRLYGVSTITVDRCIRRVKADFKKQMRNDHKEDRIAEGLAYFRTVAIDAAKAGAFAAGVRSREAYHKLAGDLSESGAGSEDGGTGLSFQGVILIPAGKTPAQWVSERDAPKVIDAQPAPAALPPSKDKPKGKAA